MTALDQFRGLVRELFQLDSAELDFGIYRILNLRRDEILRFLEDELPPEVARAFEAYKNADKADLQQELDDTIQKMKALGADPEASAKVKDLRARLAGGIDVKALENEVFSDLYTFFSRYYSEGDFISQRRYKDNVYAIPYQGEEVKLHWANHDQYYIKTTEDFSSYTIALPSGRRARFETVRAIVSSDNNETRANAERRFFLVEKDAVEVVGGDLIIKFVFKADPEKNKQAAITERAFEDIIKNPAFDPWSAEFLAPAPSPKAANRTVLEKHLAAFTARNTFDYFIHRDLGTFLRRELDFFIKNEILFLDDLSQDSSRLAQRVSKMRVLQTVAGKLIGFLEQVENFQQAIWTKRKMVLEANYCITLDRVPPTLLTEIAGCDAQRQEWVQLFAVDKTVGYSKPLSADFLRANPYLVLDTKHFDAAFKARLLEGFTNLDGAFPNLLVHGDNFHALRLLQAGYQERIECVYIDPPYNSSTTEILYKNNFKHASWLTLIRDRLEAARPLITQSTALTVAIDENEQERLGLLLDQLFSADSYDKTCVSVVHNPRGIQGSKFSFTHEYAYFLIPREMKIEKKSLEEEKSKPLMKTGGVSMRTDGPTMFYPLYVRGGKLLRVGEPPPPEFHPGTSQRESNGETEVWPIDSEGGERKWRYKGASLLKVADKVSFRPGRDGRLVPYLAKDEEAFRTVWTDAKYNAAEYGSTLLKGMIGNAASEFSFPKSLHTVKDCISIGLGGTDGFVLDFFGGSGTTAHAVIDLNRQDQGDRKFILAEMGRYFDSVLLARVKKAIYASDWDEARPTNRQGISCGFRYVRLESYEDALANLELRRSTRQQLLLDANPTLRHDYLLRYMLSAEAKEPLSFMKGGAFENPFEVHVKTDRPDHGGKAQADMVETFNFLLGLKLETVTTVDGVVGVRGTDPMGTRVLVLWRNSRKTDNIALNKWFQGRGYAEGIQTFDVVYVNGSNSLASLKPKNHTWTVRLTEEHFHRLMFEGGGA